MERNLAAAADGTWSDSREPSAKPSILLVEDDQKLVRTLRIALEADGYDVLDVPSGQRAVEEVRTRNPDVVLSDLGLPDVDGLQLVAEMRQLTTVPIIVVSGHDQEVDKVRALDAGANDYVTKPFSPGELRARIRVALRNQTHVSGTAATRIAFGGCTFDLESGRLTRAGRPIRLSRTEFKLLAALARHADQVVTTDKLLKEAWGAAYQRKSGYVRVYMHSLRHKIEKDPARPRYLVNEVGLGYRLQTTA